jgi:tetratricopeptide (TPR) repeat protein
MNNFSEYIERYLDEELSEEELAAFQVALKNDPELRKEVAAEQATRTTLYAMMVDKFRQKAILEGEFEENESQSSQEENVISKHNTLVISKKNNWKNWAMAASIIGIVASAAFFYNINSRTDYGALSSEYSFDYPVPMVQGPETEKDIVNQFYQQIKSTNYKAALITYSQLPELIQSQSDLVFFKAYCLLKEKKYQEAQKEFSSIPNNHPTLKEPIQWYILMSKLGEKQNIETDLQAIADNNNHSYQEKARELLQKIR